MPLKEKENVLGALFKWAVSEGRSPLENFCTQTMAWCLQNCPDLQKNLVGHIGKHLVQGPNIKVTPQVSKDRCFWDLEISDPDAPWRIVIECKCASPSDETQLKKYRAQLQEDSNGEQLLVTLSKSNTGSAHAAASLTWTRIAALIRCSKADDRETRFIMDAFSDFLRQKGMIAPELPKIDAKEEVAAAKGIKFWAALPILFEFFRKQELFKLQGLQFTKPVPNFNSTSTWYGTYSLASVVYVGVGISHFSESPLTLFGFVQFTLPRKGLVQSIPEELKEFYSLGHDWARREAVEAGWADEYEKTAEKVFNFAKTLSPDLVDTTKLLEWFNHTTLSFLKEIPATVRKSL